MNGLLFLLSPLIIILAWCGLTALLWKAWRRRRADANTTRWRIDGLFTVLALVWLSAAFWYGGGRKIYYDMQVNRLCAVDGGVKVYETVTLSPDKFNKWGQVNFYHPTQGENALGVEYLLKTDIQNVRIGNPSLRRYQVQVIRRMDGVLLGESIGYDRGGGDFPGPWHPSSYSCPKHHGEAVIDRLFVLSKGVQK